MDAPSAAVTTATGVPMELLSVRTGGTDVGPVSVGCAPAGRPGTCPGMRAGAPDGSDTQTAGSADGRQPINVVAIVVTTSLTSGCPATRRERGTCFSNAVLRRFLEGKAHPH